MTASLGTRLRTLRETRGFTQEQAAEAIHCSTSKISRLEAGRCRRFHTDDISALLTVYGVAGSEQSAFLDIAQQVNQARRFDEHAPGFSPRLDLLLELEPVLFIRQYEQTLIPDVLQTPEYACAALEMTCFDRSDEEIDRLVRERMYSQTILNRDDCPRLWTVIEEAALHRPIGGRRVWRRQLEWLLELIQQRRVPVQVIQNQRCGPALTRGSFTHVRFKAQTRPDFVWVQRHNGMACLDSPRDVDHYRFAADWLAAEAMARPETEHLIRELARE
ncbi:helix-turn-helix domain-containing protein [Nocardia inohanensis]|uniref:helix-turn-helix domain-containing protein n=1 Tax=Nocardia inohanensis TaxID=209246 RepID=UPI00082E79FC|nr:helix-turn-helix transcriptional regulator [Nocardia inohanensis]